MLELIFGYIIITIILILLLFVIYTRIYYPFWSIQPVFHSYDMFRYFTQNPFIIQNGLSLKTKYLCDSVISGKFLDLNEDELDKAILFLQEHLIESDRALSMIRKKDVVIQMAGTSKPSFISLYKDKQMVNVQEEGLTKFVEQSILAGIMMSRAVKIYLLERSENFEEFAYYMEPICIHRHFKNKNLGRNLIQNHERYQRFHSNVSASLFKAEQTLCDGVVPLVEYDVHTYPLSEIKKPPMQKFSIERIINSNLTILFDFLYNLTHNIENVGLRVCIFPETNVLEHLINKKQILVYVLKYKSKICGLYFFKDPRISYDLDEERSVLECIGSISTQQTLNPDSTSVYFGGFLHAIHHIQNIYNNKFKLLTIFDITHNAKIIERWKWKYTPLVMSKSAYYLYNAVFPQMPITPSKTLIIL